MLTRKKVIDNLESYMESTNQTQTDIAKRLQVTPQAINNWLTRRREPSYTAYEKIVQLLEEENHASV